MKKHLLILFAALLSLAASAQTKVEIDGIWYNLTSETQQAEVTFKGSTYNEYTGEYSGSITIPATVTHEGVSYSVTSIGSSAFYDCISLTAITIPEGVTSIGWNPFGYCISLTAITVADGNTVYDSRGGCNAIIETNSNTLIAGCSTTIIPEGVTSIGGGAFEGCRSLTSITLPESVTSIGNDAFYGCSSLTSINIPEGVKYIGEKAFWYCSSLTSINIPEGVTSIGNYAFSWCIRLTAITIPEGVTSIGDEAFEGCRSLTAITCNAITPPNVASSTFSGVDKSIPVYVPAGSVEAYKSASYWSEFTNIVPVSFGKCATPTISYADGKLLFACDTEGAEIKTKVVTENDSEYTGAELEFIPTHTFTAYATKEKYETSDVVTLTLCWIPCTEDHETGDEDGIITIPSQPVLISTQGGTITLNGLAAGTEVMVYSTAGTLLATATATDGTATLTTSLEAGNIAIVKMGSNSVKVAIK